MQIKMDLSGFNRLQQNAKAMSGSRQVKLVDLFDSNFMRKNSRYSSLQAMVDESEIEDFATATDVKKDDMVRKFTRFSNWQEFLNAAAVEYTKKQLFK